MLKCKYCDIGEIITSEVHSDLDKLIGYNTYCTNLECSSISPLLVESSIPESLRAWVCINGVYKNGKK